ncbi:N-acetyltransferase family protein [Halostagnicola bangensis]
MHVRLATTEDLESISAVARETWHDTYDELEPETIDWAIDEWYGEGGIPLEAPGTVVLVVESEDGERGDSQEVENGGGDGDGSDDDADERDDGAENDIVGFAQAVVHGDNADVLRLYVHPDYQGRGIGTTLHDRLRIQLEAYDVERIQLIDFAFNDEGRGFYESLGFEQTGEGEVEIDGKFYPELVYTLEV